MSIYPNLNLKNEYSIKIHQINNTTKEIFYKYLKIPNQMSSFNPNSENSLNLSEAEEINKNSLVYPYFLQKIKKKIENSKSYA